MAIILFSVLLFVVLFGLLVRQGLAAQWRDVNRRPRFRAPTGLMQRGRRTGRAIDRDR